MQKNMQKNMHVGGSVSGQADLNVLYGKQMPWTLILYTDVTQCVVKAGDL